MTAPRSPWSFSLRAMLLGVTVLSGVAFFWVRHQQNWIEERRAFIMTNCYSVPDPGASAPGVLGLFGESGKADICVRFESDMADATQLFPEAFVYRLATPGEINAIKDMNARNAIPKHDVPQATNQLPPTTPSAATDFAARLW